MPSLLDHADTLLPGTTLGRYEIRRVIGRGGMGCVYEAVHLDLNKRVAIKTLLPSLASSGDARARFMREGESASRIRHPHVVDITDVGAEGGTSYLVMEYLEGEDLSKLIARVGPLSPTQTADIMLPVVAAISAAHEMGVIHRDLKPENIFLGKSKMGGVHPKVLDFGISKVTGDRSTMILTGTGATFGTTFYLPPEQLRGARQADAKSDQYALGTIIYECVTGCRAFEGTNLYQVMKDIAEGRYLPPRSRRPDLPTDIEATITRAMALAPESRFPSVKEMGATLVRFASGSVRAVWQPFFSDEQGEDHFSQSGPQPVMRGTMMLPADEAAVFRPAKSSPSRNARDAAPFGNLSTLRHATGEFSGKTGPTPSLRPSRAPLFAGLAVVAVVAAVVGVMQMPRRSGPPPTGGLDMERSHEATPVARRTFRVEIETDPRAATIELDGRPVGRGALDERLPIDGTEHVLVARAPGYRDTTVRFTDQPPAHLIVLDPAPVARPTVPSPKADPTPVARSNADTAGPRSRSRQRPPKTRVMRRAPGGQSAPGGARAPESPNDAPIID